MSSRALSNWYNWKIRLFVVLTNLTVIGVFLLIANFFTGPQFRVPVFIIAVILAYPVAQLIVVKNLPAVSRWSNKH